MSESIHRRPKLCVQYNIDNIILAVESILYNNLLTYVTVAVENPTLLLGISTQKCLSIIANLPFLNVAFQNGKAYFG